MKFDRKFNAQIVSLVEKYPCLYDMDDVDHSNRFAMESAWQNIAKEVGEPVERCRTKWRNIRSCYSRHMHLRRNGLEHRQKRPYYLAKRLKFLEPFTRTKTPRGDNDQHTPSPSIFSSEKDDGEPSVTVIEENDSDRDDLSLMVDLFEPVVVEKSNNRTNVAPDAENKVVVDLRSPSPESCPSKRKDRSVPSEDACLFFLKSLIPDMLEMNSTQLRRFRIETLKSAELILKEKR